MDSVSSGQNGKFRHWWRALRPMVLWVLLVLALFGIRKHQELMEGTRIRFTMRLAGQPVYEGSATLDGEPVTTDEKISLGRHQFAIIHPKAIRYDTNLSIWYGGQDLGQIDLARSMGRLEVRANPPAPWISIRGPEFRLILTNSPGITSSVPTDRYTVEARYQRWSKSDDVTVYADSPGTLSIDPKLGAVRLTSSHQGTSFELFNAAGSLVETGEYPATVTGLVAQNYRLVSHRGNENREARVVVKAGVTNDFKVEFIYGAAVFESEPAYAQVLSGDGSVMGVTPLKLAELQPGWWRYTLRRSDYEPVEVLFQIIAGQTNIVHTNLVNSAYLRAMNAAREYYGAGNYGQSVKAIEEALRVQPDDKAAITLQRDAHGNLHLKQAKEFGQQGKPAPAAEESRLAVELLPDSEEAKSLNSIFSNQVEEIAEAARKRSQEDVEAKARQKRSNRADSFFNEWMKSKLNAELFVQNTEKVNESLTNLEPKLLYALTNGQPAFQLLAVQHFDRELISVSAKQNLGIGGWRRCDLVACQSSDGEVTIVFKVFEYAYKEALSIRAVIGDNDEKNMVPIHQSRLDSTKAHLLPRRVEGEQLVRNRFREAVRGGG